MTRGYLTGQGGPTASAKMGLRPTESASAGSPRELWNLRPDPKPTKF